MIAPRTFQRLSCFGHVIHSSGGPAALPRVGANCGRRAIRSALTEINCTPKRLRYSPQARASRFVTTAGRADMLGRVPGRHQLGSRAMNGDYSDALVVFGITGDLAFKKIFPALENLERRGRLPPVVVGVARGGLATADLVERMHASLRQHGDSTDADALRRLEAKLRYVDGDYREDATFAALRSALGASRQRPCHYLAIPPSLFAAVAEKLGASGCGRRARRRRKAARARPAERADDQPRAAARVRRALDLPDRPFPRQGAGAEPALLPLRQFVRRADLEPHARRARADHDGREASASRAAAACTKNSAPCATSCRTICCRCSRSSRWSRRWAWARRRCATRR